VKKFNPLNHVLVPKHIVLSDAEKKKFLTEREIELSQLPTISIKDPAIQNLKVKKNDIIAISRSFIGKTYTYYRRVVE